MLKKQRCPECGSTRAVKAGRRTAKIDGKRYWIQNFQCKNCLRFYRDRNVRLK